MKKFFFLLFTLLTLNAIAEEKIEKFHSDIQVNKDRSITVTETITVNVEGIQIKRGIFRDIPTVARSENRRKIRYDLDVFSVLRDGQPENYDVSGISDGKRIKIGSADVFLSPGTYTYTIKYQMGNQVRFFDNYDELYWNVTGNQWQFTIDQASATIQLPDSAIILQHQGYSGSYGDTGCQCTSEILAPNIITYKTSSPLYSYQGLTVAIGWNKGVIAPPTQAELKKQELLGYLPILVGIGGILLIFFYYLWAWFKVGRDPKKGSIIPRYEPPTGFSPAASRFVMQMGFDKKAFTSSIVSMAVKGFLTIEKIGKSYELIKLTDDKSKLTKGEKQIADALFKKSDKIEVKQSNHPKFIRAVKDLESQLKVDFMKINFNKNIGWLIPGIILSIITGIAVTILNLEDEEVFFSIIVSFFVCMFLIPIWLALYQGFKSSRGFIKYFILLFLIGIPSLVAFIAISFITVFDQNLEFTLHVSPFFLLMFALIGVNITFFYLIKAPTVYGRKRMDEIEGLKMFMEVAEKHRLNMMNPPEKTPQLFEKLLPYAIALNVENEWGKQFDSIIEEAIKNDEYHPTWYSGGSGMFRAHALTSSLGSGFSSAISSASVSPQSSGSSGSSGGGFSGGGGGGGGGGGW